MRISAADCDILSCAGNLKSPFLDFVTCAAEKCGNQCGPASQVGPGAITVGFGSACK